MNTYTKLSDLMYAQGYRKALQDVIKNLNIVGEEMKRCHIRQSTKEYVTAIKVILDNRVDFRECPGMFIRYNNIGENWEAAKDIRW